MARLTPAEIAALNAIQNKRAGALVEGVAEVRTLVGKQGPKGERGEQGLAITGPVGPIGPPGPVGVGQVGPVGPIGLAGEKGDPGEDGVGPDERVKLDGSDPEAGFLTEKLAPGLGIKFREKQGPAGRQIVIDSLGTGAGSAISMAGPPGPPGPPGPGGGGGDLSDDTPLIDAGSGDPGVGTEASRDDHVHPTSIVGPDGELQVNTGIGITLQAADDFQARVRGGQGSAGNSGGEASFRGGQGDAGAGGTGAQAIINGGEPTTGGDAFLTGGDGIAASAGGAGTLAGGAGDGGSDQGAVITARGGDGAGNPGKLEITTGGSLGPGALVSDGALVAYALAAFVEPTTATPEAIANALIAAGFMAAA